MAKIHRRYMFKHHKTIGDAYENIFEMNPILKLNGSSIKFKILKKEPFKVSSEMPFLCATPDFLAEEVRDSKEEACSH